MSWQERFLAITKKKYDNYSFLGNRANMLGSLLLREYDQQYLNQLNVTDHKKYVAVFEITIAEEEIRKTSSNLIKIDINVNSAFQENDTYVHNDRYILNRRVLPMEVIFENEFFFNKSSGTFHKNNREKTELTFLDILEHCFGQHQNLRRFGPRAKYLIKRSAKIWTVAILHRTNVVLALFYYCFSGKTVNFNARPGLFSYGFVQEEVETVDLGDKAVVVDFLIYKIGFVPIFTYSLFHLSVYVALYLLGIKPPLLVALFKNTFLTLIYVVVSLAIFERLLPATIFALIKTISRFKVQLINAPIKT